MDESLVKDFTPMRRISIILCIAFIASSCGDNTPTNGQVFIPDVPVSITVNMELPSHYHLQNLGGYSLLDGGHRGIFLVHNFDDEYYALGKDVYLYSRQRVCAYSDRHIQHPTAVRDLCPRYVCPMLSKLIQL